MSILLETIQESKEYTDKYELLSDVGTSLLFVKNNFNECLEVFNSKALSEIIEELNIDYRNILEEGMSSIIPDEKSFVDVKAIWETIKKQGDNIAYATLAAIVIAGSMKIYKNYLSKAAKACKGRSGDEKTACMTNYQKNSLSKQIGVLKKSLSFAKKSDNAKKFENIINNKIKSIQKK